MSRSAQPRWGLQPAEVAATLKAKEWESFRKLKVWLNGERQLPFSVSLKPPTGQQASGEIERFGHFVQSWRDFDQQHDSAVLQVEWRDHNFRTLGHQRLPVSLQIHGAEGLAAAIGDAKIQQLKTWRSMIAEVRERILVACPEAQSTGAGLHGALIAHLPTLEAMTITDRRLLVTLLPQLHRGMGHGGYLRALAVAKVDTKFIETHTRIIETLASVVIDPEISAVGLMAWLDCRAKPAHWLLVRPLGEDSRKALGGMPILRLAAETLRQFALPAHHILVVENEQSCLALGEFADTIAVAGAGKNTSWLAAPWLQEKKVAYWGDIDSEGLRILGDARSKLSTIQPLMMDHDTMAAYEDRMVPEPSATDMQPTGLTARELELYRTLQTKAAGRLEQERLPQDYVQMSVEYWRGGEVC